MFDKSRAEENVVLKPLVSVIIPTFNSMTGTKNIEKTLISIMDQTYPNIEILVIDNFSRDMTCQICKNFPVRFFRVNGKRSQARNYGMNKMHGDYALFADSDCILTPRIVEDCVSQALSSKADCVIIPVQFVSIRKTRMDCSQMRNLEFKLQLGVQTCTLFYSRRTIENTKFPEAVELGEDMIFSSRILRNKPGISRIRSNMYHIENGSLRNVVLRSWDYGKKLHLTISEIGSRDSTRLILDLSALNITKLRKLGQIFSSGSNALVTTVFFVVYVLVKHLSFGISYFFSRLGLG